MEVRFVNAIQNLETPIIVTDSMNCIVYKNKSAMQYLKKIRKGSSIIPHIDRNGINIVNKDNHKMSFSSIILEKGSFAGSLTFEFSDNDGDFKMWFFDDSLNVLFSDSAKLILELAYKEIWPDFNEIVNDRTLSKDDLSESLDKIAMQITELANPV